MSRYIDIEWLKKKKRFDSKQQRHIVRMTDIYSAPSIDIVRCQDCKYWVYNFNGCARNPCTEPWYATDFCNYGERME